MDWRLWLELLVRSGVLLLAGAAVLRLCRRNRAAFRHRLVLLLFSLLALLPVLSIVLPEIPVSLWRQAQAPDSLVTVQEGLAQTGGKAGSTPWNWLLLIWLGGFAVACVPLVVGSLSAWRIARRARGHSHASGHVLISEELTTPVTCGVFRRRIVLPASAQDWSDSRLEAVLLHEFAHVRRRDVAAQLGVHLVSALWWFQPLVWVMRRKLRVESEFACDAEAIGSGFQASSYAQELLGVAQSAGGAWRYSSSAIAMTRPGELETRLRAVLQPRARVVGRGRVLVMVTVLGVASLAASSVSMGSETSEEQGGSFMKRAILSTLLTSAGLSAATVGGYIHDANGMAVADAKVSIYYPDQSGKQETVTGADGRFGLNLGEGHYTLRVEKAGFASIFRTFDLQGDAKLDRDFTLVNAGAATVADSSVIPVIAPQQKHVRIGGQVAESNLVSKMTPVYPQAAKQAHVQGQVQLDVTITKEGLPLDLRVISSPSDDLSESAVEAVREWRYRPVLLNGQPVEVETTVNINYTLLP